MPSFVLGSKAVDAVAMVWGYAVLRALRVFCGISYRFEGLEHLPPTPYIIASKHQSALETIVFLVHFNIPKFILKRELVRIPVYGWYLPMLGMIAINRKGGASSLKEMVKQAKRVKEKHQRIVIFPEGTRTVPGTRVAYHPGVAALYHALDIPVIPVAVNSGLVWPKKQFVKNPGKVTFRFLPPIAPGLERSQFMGVLADQIETASDGLRISGVN